MRRFEPPPSIREIMNVEIAGTKTIVMPEVIPGTERGMTTRMRVWAELHPRSEAASKSDLSIFSMTE